MRRTAYAAVAIVSDTPQVQKVANWAQNDQGGKPSATSLGMVKPLA